MATFTDAQITDLAEIIGTDTDSLSGHLTYFASLITDDSKTRILERRDAYQAIEDKDIEVTPNDTNFGAGTSSERKRGRIRKRIVYLTFWDRYETGSYSVALERG